MFNRLLILVLLVGTLLVIQPPEAQACSGYPWFGVEDLPTMDLLVKATVIDTDYYHNAILRIEEYYKGEGERFVTVMRYSPALISGAYVRGYDTGCLYAGEGQSWVKGSQGYFGLLSNGDGTYTDYNGGTAQFFPVDGLIAYQEGATEGYAAEFDDPNTITEKEFIAQMLELGGRSDPLLPPDDKVNFYPLLRFLNITTENGTRYQINPDRSLTRLAEDAPLAISPDGAHVAFQVDEETIAFQYIYTEYIYDREYYAEEDFSDRFVPGQAVRFSNESSFAAVWDHDHLSIYMFANYGSESEYGYGNPFSINEVATIQLAKDDQLAQVMWSPDSSTLVWEDSSGIWRWNIYEDAAAERLLPAAVIEGDAALMDASTYGRYVRVGTNAGWTLIDSETGETFIDTLAAPTEKFLVYLNGSISAPQYQPCTPPLRDTCWTELPGADRMIPFIYQGNLLGLAGCAADAPSCRVAAYSWHPAIGDSHYFGGRFIEEAITGLRQVAYDPQFEQAAILVGDYDLYFDFYSDYYLEEESYLPYLDILRLEDQLDSPVVSIEWGQPIFFNEYTLATAEYLPR